MINFSKASGITATLKRQLGDQRNIVIKESQSDLRQFMICIRKISFDKHIISLLIETAKTHGIEIDIRQADPEVEVERYEPLIGKFPKSNLVAILF